MAAVFTDEEKVRIRHHLGYLAVQTASTFILGVPAAVQTSFIIEGAMDRVIEEAAPQVRRVLTILDGLEAQMVDDAELMAVNRIGDIEVNQKEQGQLESKYDYWRRALANFFGTIPNPYDQRFLGGSGVNVNVS